MTQAFLLDLTQCIGCQGCEIACNTGNELAEDVQYIRISEQVRGTFPDLVGGFDNHRCYHCTDAACVNVCPTGALFQEDGMTRLNAAACSGCRYCVQSCPYDVPRMVNGVATKCDGCRDVTKAGGTPWCVTTCPSDALAFGTREEMAAEAHARATVMRMKYPNAQVYGESQTGGLGVIMVLPEDPEVLGLPADPQIPTSAAVVEEFVTPVNLGVTAAAMVGMGLAAIIARRNHMRELEEIEAAAAAGTSGDDQGEVTP